MAGLKFLKIGNWDSQPKKKKKRGKTLSSDNTCNPNNTGKKEEMLIFY